MLSGSRNSELDADTYICSTHKADSNQCMWSLLQGLRLNKVSYATLIEAHVRAGQLSEASQWAAAASIAGVQLDAWAYTSLLKGRLQVTPSHDETGAIACTPTCIGPV